MGFSGGTVRPWKKMALKFQLNKNERIFWQETSVGCSKQFQGFELPMSTYIHNKPLTPHRCHDATAKNTVFSCTPLKFNRWFPSFSGSMLSFGGVPPSWYPTLKTPPTVRVKISGSAPACYKHSASVAKPRGGQREAVHLGELTEKTTRTTPFFRGRICLVKMVKYVPKKNSAGKIYWWEKNRGRNSGDGFFEFGKLCVLANLPEM